MEDYTARRLAEAMEDLSARLNSSNLHGELSDVSQYTRNLCMVFDENNQKMDKYIESNEKLIMEQALNNATQQFIQIKLAFKSGALDKEEVKEMLILSSNRMVTCYERSSMAVQQTYKNEVDHKLKKFKIFYDSLAKDQMQEDKKEEDFNF